MSSSSGEHLSHRQIAQIPGLVYLAVIHAEIEIIVERVLRQVVVVVEEDVLLCKIWAQLVELHPEHGIFGIAAKICGAVEHRAYGLNASLHAVCAAVELPFFQAHNN